MPRKMIDEPFIKQPVVMVTTATALPDGTRQYVEQQFGRIIEIVGDSEVLAGHPGKVVRMATPEGLVWNVGTFYLRTASQKDMVTLMLREKDWVEQDDTGPLYGGLLPKTESD